MRDRRAFIKAWLAAPFALGMAGEAAGQDARLAPTPECDDGDEATPAQTEGPFYTARSPERRSLIEPGMSGNALVLVGFVLSTRCAPVAGAVVDLWHADADGRYDNRGYRLRGHQRTDFSGRYAFETIVPGLYPGRTRHYHVKVQAKGGSVLTTQLYFPREPGNRRDGLFRPDLAMRLDGRAARFDFVLDI